MSTVTSSKNKKNKNVHHDDRSSTKRPLFEQFNEIVQANQLQQSQSKKRNIQKPDASSKQQASKEPATMVNSVNKTHKEKQQAKIPEYNSDSPNDDNSENKVKQYLNKILSDKNQEGYYSGSSYEDDPRTLAKSTASVLKTTTQQKDELQQAKSVLPENNIVGCTTAEATNEKKDGCNKKDEEEEEEEDTETEIELNNSEINDAVDSSSIDTSSKEKLDMKKKFKSGEYQTGILSDIFKSNLQWWVRNPLFQQIKIIDESHLEANGQIIQDALEKLQIDKSLKNINAYVNEIRRIIKRTMCSRRGYVKHEICEKFKTLIKSGELSFQTLAACEYFYNEEYENNEEVRKMWYIFCYHFLPRINKDWKHCLEGSRVYKQTFLYQFITTSDEAMTLWFLKTSEPKIKKLYDNDWKEDLERSKKQGQKQGEQELKAGLKDYIKFHNLISAFKDRENGIVANRWNEIFWEELVTRNPNLANKGDDKEQAVSNKKSAEEMSGDVFVLPGIDCKKNNQSMNLINVHNMRKSSKTNKNDLYISCGNDSNNVTTAHNVNNEDEASHLMNNVITNQTSI